MIQPNELRIGNWVLAWNRPFQVSAIYKEGQLNEVLDPIPLTPEILEDCGFEKVLGFMILNGKEVYDYYLNGFSLQFREDGHSEYTLSLHYFGNCGESNEEEPICTFKYLHQLQNLYFALTGRELQYNATENS